MYTMQCWRWLFGNKIPISRLPSPPLRLVYRGTSLIKKRTPVGPYRRPRVVGGVQGGWAFSCERGTPVHRTVPALSRTLPRWGACMRGGGVQGYLAHKKMPTLPEPPSDPRHRPTVGSLGRAFSYKRGTSILHVVYRVTSLARPPTLNPRPSTLSPKQFTLNPKHQT